MENQNSESVNRARLAIFELSTMLSVPMSIMAVARLNVADAMWQGGANTPLSVSEILSRILPSGGGDAKNLQRLLRMLTSYGVFSEHHDGDLRKFSLTEIGKTLVSDADGNSFGTYVLQHYQDAIIMSYTLIHEAVSDPMIVPFVKVHGENAYDYYSKRPELNELMLKGMAGMSMSFMKTLLSSYDGFEGVEKLIDLGGCSGNCLKMILQKYPNIRQAINFDQPEVVAKAPDIPGVTHIGGDIMTSRFPSVDAIFIKMVFPTFTDEECRKILENCYKALPIGGKLIIYDLVLSEDTDDSHSTRAQLASDIFIMTIYNTKGKVRSESELKKLSQLAGFSNYKPYYLDNSLIVLEFLKINT